MHDLGQVCLSPGSFTSLKEPGQPVSEEPLSPLFPSLPSDSIVFCCFFCLVFFFVSVEAFHRDTKWKGASLLKANSE